MSKNDKSFSIPRGSRVFVHQAFQCCPYAGVITSRIHDFLEVNGYRICDKPEDAAAAVINTCGFNASRSTQAIRTIGLIRKRASGIPIVVSGCLTRIERGRVRQALKGCRHCAMIGPKEHSMFDEIFPPETVKFKEVRTNLYKDRYASKDPRMGLFQILVSTGCMNKCRYCVIYKAKGQVESKPLQDVLREVAHGIELGYRDVLLVGDDLSCYGVDIKLDAAGLLGALSTVKEECKFSCEAFEPSRFIQQLDKLLPAFESGRFGWIVLPVQSGSDRILNLMGRNYTLRQIKSTIGKLRGAAPDMIISTDFIFGYPGETMDEFNESLDITGIFNYSNFNEYEQRPGTPPADIPAWELEPRRQIVTDFLRKQGSQEQVLTKNRILPYDAWTGKDGAGRRELARWIEARAAKFKGMLLEDRDIELAGGWRMERVDEDPGGVILVAVNGNTTKDMKLLLTMRDESCGCMAWSDEYNLSLISEREVSSVDEGQMKALGVLVRLLGLKQDPG